MRAPGFSDGVGGDPVDGARDPWRLSSQVPTGPRWGSEPLEPARVVHEQDARVPFADMDDRDRCRVRHGPLEQVEVRPGEVGERASERCRRGSPPPRVRGGGGRRSHGSRRALAPAPPRTIPRPGTGSATGGRSRHARGGFAAAGPTGGSSTSRRPSRSARSRSVTGSRSSVRERLDRLDAPLEGARVDGGHAHGRETSRRAAQPAPGRARRVRCRASGRTGSCRSPR